MTKNPIVDGFCLAISLQHISKLALDEWIDELNVQTSLDHGSSDTGDVATSFYAFDDVSKSLSKRAMVKGLGVEPESLEANESSKAAYRDLEEKMQKRKIVTIWHVCGL
jgi:hypothetical protein